ncbi:VOC family protein [Saxibacter everestensis]|uniref:VOC family protein n=1 Tax=Saxibacter everestensis TaxID=2909229 RepID=A0ABY8QYV9_9MICO|nr:VOC family protein [Brevibacteriaceae bacterium ZFBP1038]
MQKITPCLWFDDQAEEAATFYVSLFKNSRILNTSYYGEGSGRPAGSVLTVDFELEGVEHQALNGGPAFQFTEAISLSVSTESQEETDELWEKLTSDGGAPSMCGWLKDRFGLSWQIVPSVLGELLTDPDPEKANRVLQAMLGMRKIEIAELQRAYDGQ